MRLLPRYSAALMRLYRLLWLGRIASHPPPIPPGALVFAAHYNGAVDGFVYGSQLPPFLAVISVQWHRTRLGRWLFPGIAVKRDKDRGSSAGNLAAFRDILRQLRAGTRVLFFPEGTSRLGRERLPIGRGTLLLLRSLPAERRPPLYFVAARYRTPTRWRSDVTLGWVGPVALPAAGAPDAAWVAERLLAAQAAAYAPPVRPAHRTTWLAALLALPYLPLWYLVARLARRTADEDNVISLWKFLFGVPLTLLFAAGLTALAPWLGVPWWIPPGSLLGGWLLWNR